MSREGEETSRNNSMIHHLCFARSVLIMRIVICSCARAISFQFCMRVSVLYRPNENYGCQETCQGSPSSRLVDWTSRFPCCPRHIYCWKICHPQQIVHHMNVIVHEPCVSLPVGVGKTTLIREVCLMLKKQRANIDMCGFYTEEVREGGGGGRGRGVRVGFDVVTLNGERGILARIPW